MSKIIRNLKSRNTNNTTEHRRISFHGEASFPVQAVPEAVAIKLIGDSFYFHVAYPFKREPKNDSIRQKRTL
jgi:hypothetical protein